eukprot:CAMPEP_0170899532 /NCGR_PEP_ID=MMETSP0734-20130129/46761_1 /TAXON_ID=186038 /ORGANISM="Fragilariopsis kerguelensis, Strain L26-C5" /LENGTH=141 /DNA_ID=CAMNT_0011292613 /DNA_START=159 /DNA_END=581 /DNA_ORIENTATION=-
MSRGSGLYLRIHHDDDNAVEIIVEEVSLPPTPSPTTTANAVEIIVEEVSPPPTRIFPLREEGHPKVELDRVCYDDTAVGENLVVSYNFVEEGSTDITFQLYEMNNVEIVMLDSDSDPNDNKNGNKDDDDDDKNFAIIVNPR